MLLVLVQFLVSFAYIYWHSDWFITVITSNSRIVFSVLMFQESSYLRIVSVLKKYTERSPLECF
jgi:hypothetical protein